MQRPGGPGREAIACADKESGCPGRINNSRGSGMELLMLMSPELLDPRSSCLEERLYLRSARAGFFPRFLPRQHPRTCSRNPPPVRLPSCGAGGYGIRSLACVTLPDPVPEHLGPTPALAASSWLENPGVLVARMPTPPPPPGAPLELTDPGARERGPFWLPQRASPGLPDGCWALPPSPAARATP